MGTSGGCLQTAREAAKRLQAVFPSWFLGLSFHFLPFQPPYRRELRTRGETAGTAGQDKGRSGRINSKTPPWGAEKD